MRLNQVTLSVNNMNAAKKFYQQLGFTLIVDTPHYTRFSCPEGGSTFSLSLTDEAFASNSTIYFEHENLDNWVEDLVSDGVVFDSFVESKPYLWREVMLSDPSGNKIKLYWAGENRLNPPWKVSGA